MKGFARQLGTRFKQALTGRLARLIAVFCLFGELLIQTIALLHLNVDHWQRKPCR